MAWYNPIDWFQSGDFDSSSTGNTVQPGGRNAPGYDTNSVPNVLARNVFISDEDEQRFQELENRNQDALERQLEESGRFNRYLENSRLNSGLGSNYDSTLGKSGVFTALKLIPAWIWIVGGLAIFVYFGGFGVLRRNLSK